MNKELKPCPFCGGEKISVEYLYCRPYIICDKCHGRIPCYNTYPQAVEAWNRRVSDYDVDKVVEQLEGLLKYIVFDANKWEPVATIAKNDAIKIVKGNCCKNGNCSDQFTDVDKMGGGAE